MRMSVGGALALICSLALTPAVGALAETVSTGVSCRDALVSTVVNGEERVESTRLCVDLWTRPSGRSEVTAFASESCVKPKTPAQTCFAFKRATEITARGRARVEQPIAHPNFDLCLRLGGEPMSVRFQIGGQSSNLKSNQWQVSDRCQFIEDFSYVDLRSLADFDRSPFSKR